MPSAAGRETAGLARKGLHKVDSCSVSRTPPILTLSKSGGRFLDLELLMDSVFDRTGKCRLELVSDNMQRVILCRLRIGHTVDIGLYDRRLLQKLMSDDLRERERQPELRQGSAQVGSGECESGSPYAVRRPAKDP